MGNNCRCTPLAAIVPRTYIYIIVFLYRKMIYKQKHRKPLLAIIINH